MTVFHERDLVAEHSFMFGPASAAFFGFIFGKAVTLRLAKHECLATSGSLVRAQVTSPCRMAYCISSAFERIAIFSRMRVL